MLTATNGVCTLMPTAVPDGCCNWCGAKLTGKQRRWCSKRCHTEYFQAHDWTSARRICLEADRYVCQSCGKTTVPLDSSAWWNHPKRPALPAFDVLAYHLKGEEYRSLWRSQSHEAQKAISTWMKTYALPLSPEVNHIDPRVGQGYGFGCWNHQDNLETLCHSCHSKVTKLQRHDRIIAQIEVSHDR